MIGKASGRGRIVQESQDLSKIRKMKKRGEHNTDSDTCWCMFKAIYVPESDSYVIVHDSGESIN